MADLPILESPEFKVKTFNHHCSVDKDTWNSHNWSGPTFLAGGLKWCLSVHTIVVTAQASHHRVYYDQVSHYELRLQLLSNEVKGVWMTSSVTGKSGNTNLFQIDRINAVEVVSMGFTYTYPNFNYQGATDESVNLDVELSILRCDGDPLYKVEVPEHTLGGDLEKAMGADNLMLVGSDVTLVVANKELDANSEDTEGCEKTRKDTNLEKGLVEEPVNENGVSKSVSGDSLASSNVRYRAHKFILAARSSVFARMFKQDMLETVTNEVHISDMNPAVVKEMLTFVYTDQAPNLKEMASSLLYVAEKYELKRLKTLCERQLSSTIEIENAADILIQAHLYNAPQLKKIALNFVAFNGQAVLGTSGWKKVQENAEVLSEAMQCIFNSPYITPPAAKKAPLK